MEEKLNKLSNTLKNFKEVLEMSQYGPKKMKLYDPTKSTRRKMSRTGDVVEGAGQNRAVRSYSTKPGQLSAKDAASHEAAKMKAKSAKQPVRTLKDMSPEEVAKLKAKYETKGKVKKEDKEKLDVDENGQWSLDKYSHVLTTGTP